MSFATFLQSVSPFGPIFAKELRVTARRRGTYWLRAVYLGLLLLMLLWAWAIITQFRHGGGVAAQNQEQSVLGQVFFAIFGIFSVYAMGLLGPILTATAIGSERLHKTLAVLLMTPITSWQIIAGKLFSRLLAALTLIGLGLPVLALVRLLGGVESEQMFGVIALALVAALSTAAIGLFYSTLLNRSFAVILLSYGTMALMYVFFPMLVGWIASSGSSRNPTTAIWIIFATNPYTMVWPAAIPAMPMRMFGPLPWGTCIGSHLGLTFLLLMCSALILAVRLAGRMTSMPPRSRRRPCLYPRCRCLRRGVRPAQALVAPLCRRQTSNVLRRKSGRTGRCRIIRCSGARRAAR